MEENSNIFLVTNSIGTSKAVNKKKLKKYFKTENEKKLNPEQERSSSIELKSKQKRFSYNNFKCLYCNYLSKDSYQDILNHCKDNHPEKLQICDSRITYLRKNFYSERNNSTASRFYCPNCPSSFISSVRLNRHTKIECCRRYLCLDCQYPSADRSKIIEHLSKVHDKIINIQTQKIP